MRLIMLGTGDFALPTFLKLCESPHDVVALVTQPDRPQGRRQELIPSRIKLAAIEKGVSVYQPEDVNGDEAGEWLRARRPDMLVTAAYGQILSADVLGIPPMGGINLHGSILPSYRGAAPVARAIQDGQVEAGVTVIRMTPKIDAGGMILVATTPIDPDETAGELEGRLAEIGAPLILQAIAAVEAGAATILPQQKARVTKAPKLRKEDSPIDWSRSAQAVHDHVRAMQPWPTASTAWQGMRLIVHKTAMSEGEGPPGVVIEAAKDRLVVAAGQGAVHILQVQVPGKKAMPAADFLRGNKIQPGDRLGES